MILGKEAEGNQADALGGQGGVQMVMIVDLYIDQFG